jgi:serine protease Do
MTDTTSRLRGLARAAGAAAGIGALAGCSGQSTDGESEDETPTPDETANRPTETATPVDEQTSDCESRVSSLESDISRLDRQLSQAERSLSQAESTHAEWQAKRAQLPGGHPDERIERARAVGESIRESVVYLSVGSGQATGWFIDDGLVMTNAHNVAFGGQLHGSVTGYTLDGTELDFDVVDFVETNSPDIALLRTGTNRPALPMATDSELDPAQPLVMVGHPGGVGHWVVSLGLFVDRAGGGSTDTQYSPSDGSAPVEVPSLTTSIPGRQGNSGSPIVNMDGKVVAMLNASETHDQDEQSGQAPVAEPVIYDWPVAPRAWSIAVPVEQVREKYEAWS